MLKKLIASAMPVCLVLAIPMFAVAQDDENPREMFQKSRELMANEEYAEAAEILTKLNEKMPDNSMIHFFLGYNLHASGQLEKAIPFHEKATKSDDYKTTALYNLACAYSLKKEADKAFDYLKQSIDAGFRDLDQTTGDSDFDNIKEDPRFEEMLTLIKNDGKMPEKMKVEDFFGSWKVESGMRAGSKVSSDRLPVIKVDKKAFTIPSGEGGDPFVMSYKIDMDAKPMTVDFKIESGPVPEGNAKGIIKMKDGKVTLCYNPMGDRPEKFVSTEENGCFLFKMKKEAKKTVAKAKKSLADQMIGKWNCVKGVRSGEEVAAERMASTIEIDKKTITIPVGPDQAFVMSYELDESKSPATIDMKIEEGPAPPGSQAVGIIKMDGETFVLCYDSMGVDRPEKFEANGDGQFYFEMKKAK